MNLLETLCQQLSVWKIGQIPPSTADGIPTGFAALDAALLGSGWPASALLELVGDTVGIGEMTVLLPALARISASQGVVLVGPPFLPYAPALAQAEIDLLRLLVIVPDSPEAALACAELALRSGACGAVLLWESSLVKHPFQAIHYRALQRLHLAAGRGKTMAALFRGVSHAVQPSPAAVRIALESEAGRLRLRLFKRKGMTSEQSLLLDVRPPLLRQEIACPPSLPIWTTAVPGLRTNASRILTLSR